MLLHPFLAPLYPARVEADEQAVSSERSKSEEQNPPKRGTRQEFECPPGSRDTYRKNAYPKRPEEGMIEIDKVHPRPSVFVCNF